jgi:hypothetical protein
VTTLRGGDGSRVAAPSAMALVALLALALWVASTLGLVHRTVHPPVTFATGTLAAGTAGTAGTNVDSPAPSATRETPHAGAGRGLAALFGPHGEGDCRLYDQLVGGIAMPSVPFVLLPVVLPTARFHYFLGEALARWVALFDARGPPSAR